jgi:small subunit ribosomal protein S7
MSRKVLKNKIKKFYVLDAKYNSIIVTRFINKISIKGKKSLAESIVYESFDIIKKQLNEDPIIVFNRAIENTRPLLDVKPRRIGGSTYQVPIELSLHRSITLAINWIIKVSRKKIGKSMSEKLAHEIIDASKKEGSAIKIREDTHKMAESNKAFAHFRW